MPDAALYERPRALLVQPPVYDFALYDLFLQPLGLLRIGSWLAGAGYEVELLDGLSGGRPRRDGPGRGKVRREQLPTPEVLADLGRSYARYGMTRLELRRRMVEANPDVVLITSGMTYWYPGIAEVAELAYELFPAIPVIIGGVYATLLPDHCRKIAPHAHVLPGDASVELARTLEREGLPRPKGPLPQNPPPGGAEEQASRVHGAAVLRLHAGCRSRCTYCASRVLAPRFTPGDPDAVAETMSAWMRQGVRTFAFYDDALLEDAEQGLLPLSERLLGRYGEGAMEIHLPNAIHARKLTPRIARQLRRMGVREVRLGVESLDEAFHRRYDGKLTSAELEETVRMLETAGFRTAEIIAYVLAGLPGQEAGEVEASVRELRSRGLAVSISEYSPVPGSALFEEACGHSRYPLASEPLCQNNSVFPTASELFTRDDLSRIKRLARGG